MKQLKTIIKSTLIIDYEEIGNTNLINIFSENGLLLDIVASDHDYLNRINQKKYDCVMINSDLADNLAVKIIDTVKGYYPWIIVVILLQNPDYEKIFNFVRNGADDFIMKPFSWTDMEKVLKFYYY